MTTARKSNSTSPTKAAAAKAEAAAQEAEVEAQRLAMVKQFQEMVLPEPVLDEDGYETVPDKSTEPGGSYKFTVRGNRYQLPNLQYLPVNIAQQLPKLGDQAGLELVLSRYAPDLLEHATADQLLHISKRWMEHSKGMTLGE